MTWLSVLLGAIVAVSAIIAIEKKRGPDGKLTYPLWRCNLLLLWVRLTALCALLTGIAALPRYVQLSMHSAKAEAVVRQVSHEEHCRVNYDYKANGTTYTGLDSLCGLNPGDTRTIYYDTLAPSSSTLYFPKTALKNELFALMLISLLLSTSTVIWFRATYIVGSRRKP